MNDLFKPKELKEDSIDALLEEPKEETFPEEKKDGEKQFLIFPEMKEEVLDYYMHDLNWKLAFMNFKIQTKHMKREYDLALTYHYEKAKLSFMDIRVSEIPKKKPIMYRERGLNDIMDGARILSTSNQDKPENIIKSKEVYTWIGHQKKKNCYNASLQFISPLEVYGVFETYRSLKDHSYSLFNLRVLETQVCMLNEKAQLASKDEYMINPLIRRGVISQDVVQIPHSKADNYPELELMKGIMSPR